MEKQTQTFQRLQSLDTFRGFDMFFIMGGNAFFVALATLIPLPFFQAIAGQMEHVEWNGLAMEDMIFPTFLFIAGISFPYSLAKQRAKGMSSAAIYKKLIRRGLTLVVLGIIYNGLFSTWDFATARYGSVLGRIGLAWMFGALIFVNTKTITRVWITAALLIGYWLLLNFVPAPDANGADRFSMQGCLVGYVDRVCMPGHLYKEIHDPEGLLGTIPAIGTALLGMFTGEFVRLQREKLTGCRKVLYMLICGAAFILLGILWNQVFPFNKNIWSSSFVCTVGGISMMLFAIFYYIVDVKNYHRWTLFFRVIGMNSITIYLAQRFIDFQYSTHEIFDGLANLSPATLAPMVLAIGYIALCWLFLYFLYRQKIFLKV
jgi:predicted acyltransferase